MLYKTVPTANIVRFDEASHWLIQRPTGSPGMALVHGPTGYGKTTAAHRLVTKCNGVYVRANTATTMKGLLEDVADELELPTKGSAHVLLKRIVEKLTITQRPLFIDEAEFLLKKDSTVEIVRDLHDLSAVPVTLIGMHTVKKQLMRYPQFTGRLAQFVEFQPNTLKDAKMLAKAALQVDISNDLLESVYNETQGSMRLLVVSLGNIEKLARNKGLEKVEITDWPAGKPFFFGNPPMRNV